MNQLTALHTTAMQSQRAAFYIRLWVTAALLVLSVCTQGQQSSCPAGEFLDEDTDACKNCTNCTSLGMVAVVPCSDNLDADCQTPQTVSDCTDGEQFLNAAIQRCQNCTQLECDGNSLLKPCQGERDSVCISCADGFNPVPQSGICVIDCTLCPAGVGCRDSTSCDCDPPSCYTDPFCRNKRQSCIDDTPPTDGETPATNESAQENSIPSWGIGLIAIGIVIGIVAFSGCFLLMGFCTSRRKESVVIGSEESANSQSALVTSCGNSARITPTITRSYLPNASPLFNQNALDLLRQSPSSLRSSPSIFRDSPDILRHSPEIVRHSPTNVRHSSVGSARHGSVGSARHGSVGSARHSSFSSARDSSVGSARHSSISSGRDSMRDSPRSIRTNSNTFKQSPSNLRHSINATNPGHTRGSSVRKESIVTPV